MSVSIAPGDLVRIISTDIDDADDYGREDVVRDVGDDGYNCGKCGSEIGVWLRGDDIAFAWCICEVDPIQRPSQSLFLTRLMDTPADPEQVMA